jgi:hypothetical protein
MFTYTSTRQPESTPAALYSTLFFLTIETTEIKFKEVLKIFYAVIWKEQVKLVVGAASSRDHLVSRLEAAPTYILLC